MQNEKNEKTNPGQVPVERYDAVSVVKGIWRDEVYRIDPKTGQEVLVEGSNWTPNKIVGTISKLLAGLMKNDVSFIGGILFHAQGRGLASFDVSLPVPPFSATQLVDEYFRKAPDSIVYLDGLGVPTATPTGSILIKTTLGFLEANGVSGEFIREQGLFGGTATAALNSGLMVNLIFHKARFKDAGVKIIRFINLIF